MIRSCPHCEWASRIHYATTELIGDLYQRDVSIIPLNLLSGQQRPPGGNNFPTTTISLGVRFNVILWKNHPSAMWKSTLLVFKHIPCPSDSATATCYMHPTIVKVLPSHAEGACRCVRCTLLDSCTIPHTLITSALLLHASAAASASSKGI
jgi:hypothetical protein